MSDIDVQLYSQGVVLRLPLSAAVRVAARDPEKCVGISHPQFDVLAEQVAEAALNKRGRSYVTLCAEQVQVGDHVLGREVINVRAGKPATDMVTYNLKPFGYLLLEVGDMLRVERPIS